MMGLNSTKRELLNHEGANCGLVSSSPGWCVTRQRRMHTVRGTLNILRSTTTPTVAWLGCLRRRNVYDAGGEWGEINDAHQRVRHEDGVPGIYMHCL